MLELKNNEETWKESSIIVFDPNNPPDLSKTDKPTWLKPLKWNQGG